MNVLILTPDAVGSTLLQRLITIYMQFHNFDRPVINLHELSNGLVSYYNSTFNQKVLGKKPRAWGYHQSLKEIVELLSSVDHYKTSRLAHYHIRSRQDSMADQVPFYQYLNDNFYIISCRRHNLFEHALSWSLSKITKKLNVYDDNEKIDSFFEYYKNGIDLDPNSLLNTLDAYRDYTDWCNNHFNVANYFYYEEHLPRIEQYILNLPIFAQQTKKLTWKDNFNIEFDQWNLGRYLSSDLGVLALEQPEKFAQLTNSNRVTKTDNNYQVQLSQSLTNMLPETHQTFLTQHKPRLDQSLKQIQTMVQKGVLVSVPPIKKQTLSEKKHIVKNFQHLLEVYNRWIEKNPNMGNPLDQSTIETFANIERSRWKPGSTAVALSDQ